MNKITWKKIGIGLAGFALLAGALACSGKTASPSGSGGGAHAVATTAVPVAVQSPAAPPSPTPVRTPVSVSGKGNKAVTVNLMSGGYMLSYKATNKNGFTALIVHAMNADGSDQGSLVNDLADSGTLEGSTVTGADDTGPYLFKISNADNTDWTLTFTPVG